MALKAATTQNSTPAQATPTQTTPTQTTPTQTPSAQASAGGKRNSQDQKREFYKEFKRQGAILHEEEVKTGEAQADGSKQGAVAYLYALGNPAKYGTRTEKGVSDIKTMDVVGYAFKAIEDVLVPVCQRVGINKSDVMGYSSIDWVEVKAGQEFNLSKAELGEMITQNIYNGMFTGDPDNKVELAITFSAAAGNTYAPQCILKKVIEEGKDSKPVKANIIPVATKKEGTSGKSVRDFEVLPEYKEKFGYIFEEVQSGGRSGSGSQKREVGQSAAELAAAFRAFKRNKEKAQG